jgi:hypothetical protein
MRVGKVRLRYAAGWPGRHDPIRRIGRGRRFGYFLDRINTGNRYYHKVRVFPVSKPKARTATGHRFDPVNPKDEDACGSESICSGRSRPTIEVGGSGATALTCSAKGKRDITKRACHCPLPQRKVWAAVSSGLPEGPLTEARALCGGGLGRQGPLSELVCDGSLSGGHLPPRSGTQRRAVPTH